MSSSLDRRSTKGMWIPFSSKKVMYVSSFFFKVAVGRVRSGEEDRDVTVVFVVVPRRQGLSSTRW